MGQWFQSPRQTASVQEMFAANLRLCRSHVDIIESTSGRGMHTLNEHLSAFEAALEQAVEPGAASLAKQAAVAMPVDPARVAVPEQAGLTNPVDWLPPDQAAEFQDWRGRVIPEEKRGPLARCCLMISRRDEQSLRKKLWASGMAVLVPEQEVEMTPAGVPLVGGVFSVPSKPTKDRLIFDRRPQNSQETRAAWCTLPLGSQVCRIILGPSDGLRASGDDLRVYYYCLLAPAGSEARNALGRVVTGPDAAELGGSQQCRYRLCLKVLGMGDHNAVDFAHAAHEALLRRYGCMDPRHVVRYGFAFPRHRLFEFLYIDDHIVTCVCLKSDLGSPLGPDRTLIEQSHAAYLAARLTRADDKAFGFAVDRGEGVEPRADSSFVVLGSAVSNEPGIAECPSPSGPS